jgi:hypothetical protein
MPNILQGNSCYLGNLPNSKASALYEPCSGPRGGEDITVTKDGLAIPENNLAWNRDTNAVTCRPLTIKLTMYGDEILFDCENKTEKDLFNFISKDRLVITWRQ